MQIVQGNPSFSGKIYTADKNFTRPPVATVATNFKSGTQVHSNYISNWASVSWIIVRRLGEWSESLIPCFGKYNIQQIKGKRESWMRKNSLQCAFRLGMLSRSRKCICFAANLSTKRPIEMLVFIGPESDHWECLSVTNWLTHSLTAV